MRRESDAVGGGPLAIEHELRIGPDYPEIECTYVLKLRLEAGRIGACRADWGYLHRGMERLMERRRWIQNLDLASRLCAADPLSMEASYALAVEHLCGLAVPERGQWLRVLALELSRIAAHLRASGALAAAVGLYGPGFPGIADRRRILDRIEELAGARVCPLYLIPGGVRRDLPEGFSERLGRTLDRLESALPDYDRRLFAHRAFLARARGSAPIDRQQAIDWAVTGPNRRATGLGHDLRRDQPYLVYDRIDFDIPTEAAGDAWARAQVRRREIGQSIRILRQVLTRLPQLPGPVRCGIPNPLAWRVPAGDAHTRVESSRGELAWSVVSDGGERPRRIQVRGPSQMHRVQVLERLAIGCRIEDLAPILFSLDTCAAEVDR